ncbi:MAG: beta-ketoacyl-[acyl-carrier-protein] synthase II, partial [Burkholderiaceae bacterium]
MLYLNQLGIIFPIGQTHDEIAQRLFAGQSGVVATELYSKGRSLPLGVVDAVLPSVDHLPLPERS